MERRFHCLGSWESVVWIEGDVGTVAGAGGADAAALRVHRDPSGRRRGNEAQTGGAVQHWHRPGRAIAVVLRLRLPGGTGLRGLPCLVVGFVNTAQLCTHFIGIRCPLNNGMSVG